MLREALLLFLVLLPPPCLSCSCSCKCCRAMQCIPRRLLIAAQALGQEVGRVGYNAGGAFSWPKHAVVRVEVEVARTFRVDLGIPPLPPYCILTYYISSIHVH